MHLTHYPFRLQFKHTFHIATSVRTGTYVVYVQVHEGGQVGYGEAALPPYLPETIATVSAFLSQVRLPSSFMEMPLPELIDQIHQLQPANTAAKAALDIALHDLYGKLNGKNVAEVLGIDTSKAIQSTYTIGIGTAADMATAVREAANHSLVKLKLGGEDDKAAVNTLLSLTDKPFCVDVNQGWTDLHHTIEMAHWLAEKGAYLLEQPLPKHRLDDMAKLTEQSPIPIFADESVWQMDDLRRVQGACHGVNIKLMKTGGLQHALAMIKEARRLNLKLLMGCMSESSCAVTAAAYLATLCDYADLDGPNLINNDPFTGVTLANGYLQLPKGDGLGIDKIE